MVGTIRHMMNATAVRRYYERNRGTIIRHKTLLACRRDGRVPRSSTMDRHGVTDAEVYDAFATWLAEAPATAIQRQRRCAKLERLARERCHLSN